MEAKLAKSVEEQQGLQELWKRTNEQMDEVRQQLQRQLSVEAKTRLAREQQLGSLPLRHRAQHLGERQKRRSPAWERPSA